jgi:hypothetical protein
MAVFAGKGVAATAHDAGTKLTTAQLAGRVRCSTDYISLDAAANAGATMKLAWVPYGATIVDGYVTHEATNTSLTIKGGIVGASSTPVDNDDDLFFTALAAATAAESRSAPKRLQKLVMTGTTPGYKVTDPNGAYVILTTAGAANGASAALFSATVFWVMD